MKTKKTITLVRLSCVICSEKYEADLDFLVNNELVCCPHCNKASRCEIYLKSSQLSSPIYKEVELPPVPDEEISRLDSDCDFGVSWGDGSLDGNSIDYDDFEF
jgi:hypothetical protein